MAPHKRFFDLQAMASGSFRCRKNVASLFCTKAFSLFAHFGIVLLRLFAGFPLPNQSVFSATCFICHILNGHHFMSTNTSLKFAKVWCSFCKKIQNRLFNIWVWPQNINKQIKAVVSLFKLEFDLIRLVSYGQNCFLKLTPRAVSVLRSIYTVQHILVNLCCAAFICRMTKIGLILSLCVVPYGISLLCKTHTCAVLHQFVLRQK
jgi:hypothetical protein